VSSILNTDKDEDNISSRVSVLIRLNKKNKSNLTPELQDSWITSRDVIVKNIQKQTLDNENEEPTLENLGKNASDGLAAESEKLFDILAENEELAPLPRSEGAMAYCYTQGIPIRIHAQDNEGVMALVLNLTAVNPDGLTLESGGTLLSVTRYHTTRNEYGNSDRWGEIPPKYRDGYPFQAVAPLYGLSRIGDAMLGISSWDSPSVMLEVNKVLSMNDEQFDSWYTKWKISAIKAYKKAWNEVMELEKAAFIKAKKPPQKSIRKSYFDCKEYMERLLVPDTDIEGLDSDDTDDQETDDGEKRNNGKKTTSKAAGVDTEHPSKRIRGDDSD
jgi:hypothetical protein